jgi:putative oxidoreductase
MNLLQRFKHIAGDATLFAARLTFGGYMAMEHGLKKFYKWDTIQHDFANPLGIPDYWSAALTIWAELYCCILIVLGLFTRFSALTNAICMLIAALVVHGGDPMDERESAFIYFAGFILLVYTGGGRWSIDHLLRKTRIAKWL